MPVPVSSYKLNGPHFEKKDACRLRTGRKRACERNLAIPHDVSPVIISLRNCIRCFVHGATFR